MALVEADGVVFGYGNRPVVEVNHLRLDAGQCLGMFGPNGSGKTTLVRGLMGLLPTLSGKVRRASNLRIGYLPQHRSIDLQWPMTGIDAASMVISSRQRLGWVNRKKTTALDRALKLLEVESIAAQPFKSMSGGQQQRILLAGALAADPQLLVLDEPTEGLDVRSRRILLDALRTSSENTGLCSVLISHSVDDLTSACAEALWLQVSEINSATTVVECIPAEELADRVRGLRAVV